MALSAALWITYAQSNGRVSLLSEHTRKVILYAEVQADGKTVAIAENKFMRKRHGTIFVSTSG